jgi:hypothetical protein
VEEESGAFRACLVAGPGPIDLAMLGSLAAEGDTLTRGAMLCRAGRHDEAVRVLRQSPDVVARFYQALAEHGRGQPTAARTVLAEAKHWLKRYDRGRGATHAALLPWDIRLEIELLGAELERLLPPELEAPR